MPHDCAPGAFLFTRDLARKQPSCPCSHAPSHAPLPPHTQPPHEGDYHYHFPPSCLIKQADTANPTTQTAAGHSAQVGWAWDGFPIYGPLYSGGVAVTGLDACSGKEEAIPDLDSFKYRYYFTGATSNLYEKEPC